jgi:integrase
VGKFYEGEPAMSKSTRHKRRSKRGTPPPKPSPDFPLFAHANGLWCRKIKGVHRYFGTWDDPEGALAKYKAEVADWLNDRTPQGRQDGLTIKQLVNKFLNAKRYKLETGMMTKPMFGEYYLACVRIADTFGRDRLVEELRPADFERMKFAFPRTWGPLRIGKMIQLVRSVMKYAWEQDLIDKQLKFGSEFKRPSKAVLRLHRASLRLKNGDRMFSAAELRLLIEKARGQYKAILLLAANCGFGNTDCARLPKSALNLETGWVDYPRPKTGIERRCPLWPETVEALRHAIDIRPKAKNPDDGKLVFLTRHGRAWTKVSLIEEKDGRVRVVQDDAVQKRLVKMMKKLGIMKPGRGFYAIRHGFLTVGEGVGDPVAVHFLMGHGEQSGDMSAHYREKISDDRLRRAVNHIHAWLFGDAEKTPSVELPKLGTDG